MTKRLNEGDIEEILESSKKTQWQKIGNVYSVGFPEKSNLQSELCRTSSMPEIL
jgi:uncharacterized metal-binding protein